MSDTGYTAFTKDEFIQRFGYDPSDTAIEAKDDPYIKNHLKSAAVGALSIPTDLIALPGLAMSGASALYRSQRNDTKFLDEFQKDIMSEGARDKIQEHIGQIQQTWRQQHPEATDEEIKYGTDEYLKSKQFEDFQTSQLSGTAWLQAKARDTIRRALGDERPSSQRSWTEGAAEAIGGALVPGPAGWAAKAGGAAARTGGVTNALVNSTVGRGTLKTAEVLTPLTMPYTPTNVAVNAAAGVAIDQAMNYALDKPTAFTPTPEDQAGVGTLGVIGGGVVAGAAFVAAVKGRTHAALNAAQQTHTGAAVQGQPTLNAALAEPQTQGAASIVGGAANTNLPRSNVETLPAYQQIAQQARRNVFDEGSMIDRSIQDIHGGEAATKSESIRNSMSNAVTNETSEQLANIQLYDLNAMLRNMPPEDARAFVGGWLSHSMDAHAKFIMDGLLDEVRDLTARLSRPNVSQRTVNALTPQLQEAQSRITRMLNDDPTARVGTPDIPMRERGVAARAWESDPAPHMVAAREEIKKINKANLDQLVASNTLSARDAAMLFARNQYYAPLVDDPFHGKTGIARVWAQGLASLRGRPQRATTNPLYNDPINKYSADLFGRHVVAPMHPLSALQRYTERLYKNKAQTLGRNQLLKMLTEDTQGNPSQLVVDKKIQIYENPGATGAARTAWIEPEGLHHMWVQKALAEPGVVPQMQGGRMRLWHMADPEWASVLRNDPINAHAAWNAAGAATNFFKFWTTGRGYLPFAFKGLLYDMPIMILARRADRAFGPLTYGLHKYAPGFANKVGRYIPDVTAYAALPRHALAVFIETQAERMSKYLSQQLSSEFSAFRAIENVVGTRAYQKMLQTSLKVAAWSEETPTAILRRGGGMRTAHTIDNIDTVRSALADARDMIPKPLRAAWQFYTDFIDMLYGSSKRQYFTQNYALMAQKYNGRVPQHVVDQLVSEARNAAGDMTKTPGSKALQHAERVFPYLTQSKLGAYYLYRNMAGADTYHYMLPRLSIAMSAIVASVYWRTYWNEESRNNYWNETPAHERWRTVSVPHPDVMIAHFNGTKLPYDRNKYWNLTLPPDIVPMVAGAVAMAQQLGWIPANATPKPIAGDLPNFLIDSLTPAMPPLLQAILSQSNMKLDPQSSETRGGNWMRSFGSNFKAGPQAESFSNLGQVTNSTALFLSAMFGSTGSHIALGTDVMMHAAKYKTEFGPAGTLTPQEATQFGRGLRLATENVLHGLVDKIPDIPFMWRANEKRAVSTPAWQYVKENDQYLRSIKGMRNDVESKTAAIQREAAINAGGLPQALLTDAALIKIANDLNAYQAPKGDLGVLRKQYNDLLKLSRSVGANYNIPADTRRVKVNEIIQKQQANMVQQQLAVKYAEQQIEQVYGRLLAPRLKGRGITMRSIDQMLRESMGGSVTEPAQQQSGE